MERRKQGRLLRHDPIVELLELRAAAVEGPGGAGLEIGALAPDELCQVHISFGGVSAMV